MRRILAPVLLLALALPATGALATSTPLKCVWDNNRIGFPYGGTEINPEETVFCYL